MARPQSDRAHLLPLIAEVFRDHGYEGASLNLIGNATGLGKGSLYHFFPGGKEEMADAVLNEIGNWFEHNIFDVLRGSDQPEAALLKTLDATAEYFRSGRRICLVGAFALSDTRDRFSFVLRRYFNDWRLAMASALERSGHSPADAKLHAEDAISSIQGALVLARALDEADVFARAIDRVRTRLPAGRTATKR
ncbi:MAG: TetR/AcrR family transcriptional regulator [Afipia sp.]|uniref:TetR/AcrR family transcriptional regulator n=1 Tax=Parvibaculum sp. TaxID=2024848 RepID=UPI00273135CC|nr:TetR/AcrR family transcriptional regulator [Parvibaculum sp.]MDP2149566.1 TetR/AcrR family transcriptional regulator [Parvibaculum sp.]MDZ4365992.1 TetR/AcrR family transcriptional regulator [Afipia sp.]